MNAMEEYHQDLFSQMRRRDGITLFDGQTCANLYKARHYVLKSAPLLGGKGLSPTDPRRLHAIIEGDSDLMLSIARQIALVAHYPNFNERDTGRRTLITILYNALATPDIVEKLSREEFLYNLPKVCKCSLKRWSDGGAVCFFEMGNDSFVDIELELIGFDGSCYEEYSTSCEDRENEIVERFNQKEVEAALDKISDIGGISHIDIRRARRANMVYYVGCDLYNLPLDDPYTAIHYNRALHYFCFHQKAGDACRQWNSYLKTDNNGHSVAKNATTLKSMLSNVFCTDCFESRLLSVIDADVMSKDLARKFPAIADMALREKLKMIVACRYDRVLAAIKANLKALALCEHSRWSVEKLILGFMPFSDAERLEDECRFGEERDRYRKMLKNRAINPIHVDICSYAELRRIDPGNMKFDCFLMMAMPYILKASDC